MKECRSHPQAAQTSWVVANAVAVNVVAGPSALASTVAGIMYDSSGGSFGCCCCCSPAAASVLLPQSQSTTRGCVDYAIERWLQVRGGHHLWGSSLHPVDLPNTAVAYSYADQMTKRECVRLLELCGWLNASRTDCRVLVCTVPLFHTKGACVIGEGDECMCLC